MVGVAHVVNITPSADAQMCWDDPTHPYGGTSTLNAGMGTGTDGWDNSLLQFNGIGSIGSTNTVLSASLNLTWLAEYRGYNGTNTGFFTITRVTQAWNEPAVTWYTYDGTHYWNDYYGTTDGGGDAVNQNGHGWYTSDSSYGFFAVGNGGDNVALNVGAVFSTDVTALVQQWINNPSTYPNYGLEVAPTGGLRALRLLRRRTRAPTLRPR